MTVPALFVLDVALVLIFALLLAAALRPPSRSAFLISAFILAWSNIVLTTEGLSLLTLITPAGMLAAHVVLTLAALLVWNKAGRPHPPRFPWPSREAIANSIRAHPELWVLGLAVVAVYAFHAILILLVPPNNSDSLNYHLTRVAFWIQHGSLAPWPTVNFRQTSSALNAEIGSLWSMVFLRSDVLAGFVQWVSAAAAMISIFGTARLFGYSRRQSAFAVLVYATLPMILLQSTTTQNDLTTAALFTAMTFLLLAGLRSKHTGMLLLSGAAMGLTLGSKATAFLALPGFALGLGWILLSRRPRPFRRTALWAAACLAGFALLGAFNFVQNWRWYENPVAPRAFIAQESGASSRRSRILTYNLAHEVCNFADFAGVPRPVADRLVALRVRGGRFLFKALGLRIGDPRLVLKGYRAHFHLPAARPSEASSYFGPLGFLLILPLVLTWTVRGFIKRDDRFIPAMVFLGFMVVLGSVQAWHQYRGRYYALAVTACAPLFAGAFGRGKLMRPVRWVVVAMAAMVMAVTVATNVRKPLVGEGAIWTMTREERRWSTLAQVNPNYLKWDALIPRDATVASVLLQTDPEYRLFGPRLTRKVVSIVPQPMVVDLAWLRKHDFEWFLVREKKYIPVADVAGSEYRVYEANPYKIIRRVRNHQE